MKKYLKLESLIRADVPQELDLRILAAAKLRRTAMRRKKRLSLVAGGVAAAAAFLVAAGLFIQPGAHPVRPAQEDRLNLAALSDWTNVEQAGYNLASEISSSSSFMDLTDGRANFEV